MRVTLFFSLALMLTGCSLGGSTPIVQPPLPPAAVTFTPIATLTSRPESSPTGTAEPTPAALNPTAAAFVPFNVVTSADNLALRKGPGYLFARIGLLPEGELLLVMSRSRGGEWAMVQTSDKRVGWAFVQLLGAKGHDWGSVPTSEPLGAQLITGIVKDDAGVPISGVQFAFTQGSGPLAPRTDALTDQTGTFYAYFPDNITGSWNLSYTAIACSSNTMDAGCNPKNGRGGRPYPESQSIILPLISQAPLQFVWR